MSLSTYRFTTAFMRSNFSARGTWQTRQSATQGRGLCAMAKACRFCQPAWLSLCTRNRPPLRPLRPPTPTWVVVDVHRHGHVGLVLPRVVPQVLEQHLGVHKQHVVQHAAGDGRVLQAAAAGNRWGT